MKNIIIGALLVVAGGGLINLAIQTSDNFVGFIGAFVFVAGAALIL